MSHVGILELSTTLPWDIGRYWGKEGNLGSAIFDKDFAYSIVVQGCGKKLF